MNFQWNFILSLQAVSKNVSVARTRTDGAEPRERRFYTYVHRDAVDIAAETISRAPGLGNEILKYDEVRSAARLQVRAIRERLATCSFIT